jgi:hypothetical protein
MGRGLGEERRRANIKPPPSWGRFGGGQAGVCRPEESFVASSADADNAPPPNPPHKGEGLWRQAGSGTFCWITLSASGPLSSARWSNSAS